MSDPLKEAAAIVRAADGDEIVSWYSAVDRLLRTGLMNENAARDLVNKATPVKESTGSNTGQQYRMSAIKAKLEECAAVADREAREKIAVRDAYRDIIARMR